MTRPMSQRGRRHTQSQRMWSTHATAIVQTDLRSHSCALWFFRWETCIHNTCRWQLRVWVRTTQLLNLLISLRWLAENHNTSDIFCTFCKHFGEDCSWVQQRTRPRPGPGSWSLLFLMTTMRNALFGAMARESHNWTPQRCAEPRCVS